MHAKDDAGIRQVPEGSGELGKVEKTGCKIICGAPTTLAGKGLTTIMMTSSHWSCAPSRRCEEVSSGTWFQTWILFSETASRVHVSQP